MENGQFVAGRKCSDCPGYRPAGGWQEIREAMIADGEYNATELADVLNPNEGCK